jgi:hypothetical protein
MIGCQRNLKSFGMMFIGWTGARSSDEEILAIAPKHPTFEVVPVGSADG